MKKILLIAFLCTPFFSKAQIGISVGPETGFSFSTLTAVQDNTLSGSIETLYVGFSYHFGAAAHVQIGDWFAVRPAIYYKGSNMIGDFQDLKINDIEIPINILFSRQTNSGTKIFFGAGPNILYSLSGSIDDGVTSRDLKFGSATTDDLKPMGLGLNGKFGMQFGFGFGFNLYFNAGMGDRSTTPDLVRWRSADLFGLNLSYLFGGNGGGGSF